MTALNLIAQPASAIILSDTAVTDGRGLVLDIGSKVQMFPELGVAIAWTGYGPITHLATREARIAGAIRDRGPTTHRDLLAMLPRIVRDLHLENQAMIETRNPADHAIALFAAVWDAQKAESQIWACHSDNVAFGPSYQPYSCVRLVSWIGVSAPGMNGDDMARRALGRPVDFADPDDFRAETDGIELLEAQRRIRKGVGTLAGRYCVGGSAELTTVSAAGIARQTLRTWPDRIGRIIKPVALKTEKPVFRVPRGTRSGRPA